MGSRGVPSCAYAGAATANAAITTPAMVAHHSRAMTPDFTAPLAFPAADDLTAEPAQPPPGCRVEGHLMRRFALLLAFAAACGLFSASAQAAVKTTRGPCGTGPLSPTCYFWTGKVVFIGDGDTISVVLDGDKSKTHQHVRFAGINATEEYVHTDSVDDRVGECHANDATDELVRLVRQSKGRVRLAAENPNAMSGGNRIRRAVFVSIRGKWRDVGRELLKRGDALFLNGDEHAWNYSYSVLAQRAAAQKVGIWNADACASGPPANVKLWVNSDADGADASNPNGDWIRIKN